MYRSDGDAGAERQTRSMTLLDVARLSDRQGLGSSVGDDAPDGVPSPLVGDDSTTADDGAMGLHVGGDGTFAGRSVADDGESGVAGFERLPPTMTLLDFAILSARKGLGTSVGGDSAGQRVLSVGDDAPSVGDDGGTQRVVCVGDDADRALSVGDDGAGQSVGDDGDLVSSVADDGIGVSVGDDGGLVSSVADDGIEVSVGDDGGQYASPCVGDDGEPLSSVADDGINVTDGVR